MEAEPTLTNNVRLRNNEKNYRIHMENSYLELCKNKKLNGRIGDNITWKTDLQKLESRRVFDQSSLFSDVHTSIALYLDIQKIQKKFEKSRIDCV